MKLQRITILGATGSIGQNTLDVIAQHPERFQVFALTANTNVADMLTLCQRHQPSYAVMVDTRAAEQLRQQLPGGCRTEVLVGAQALEQVCAAHEVDQVMAAIVGAAGLAPTLAAVRAGKRVLLANKEALVMSGQLFIDELVRSQAELLPVDSEHNAIFQCLTPELQQQVGTMQLHEHGIQHILLTGSGGPFLNLPIDELSAQTPSAACAHPNWTMGQKISVDSATMLNKGLEYIEARWLFNCQPEQLLVLIHPQSVIHSMVQYRDGSVLAQMGQPDMRTPIAHSMLYPERGVSGVNALDFARISELTFVQPDVQRFPCLSLAQQACWQGQAATTALNATNEEAVAAFLNGQIGFTQIAQLCDQVLQQMDLPNLECIQAVVAFDQEVRRVSQTLMRAMA